MRDHILTLTPSKNTLPRSISTCLTLNVLQPSELFCSLRNLSLGVPDSNRTLSPGRIFHLRTLSLGWTKRVGP